MFIGNDIFWYFNWHFRLPLPPIADFKATCSGFKHLKCIHSFLEQMPFCFISDRMFPIHFNTCSHVQLTLSVFKVFHVLACLFFYVEQWYRFFLLSLIFTIVIGSNPKSKCTYIINGLIMCSLSFCGFWYSKKFLVCFVHFQSHQLPYHSLLVNIVKDLIFATNGLSTAAFLGSLLKSFRRQRAVRSCYQACRLPESLLANQISNLPLIKVRWHSSTFLKLIWILINL